MLYSQSHLVHIPAGMPYTQSPPSVPDVCDIYDEAADSPRWLPALGLGLAMLLALVFAVRAVALDPRPPTAATPSQSSDEPSAPSDPGAPSAPTVEDGVLRPAS